MSHSDNSLHKPFLRRRLIGLAALTVAVLAILSVWWFERADPARLLDRGLVVGRQDPAAGERLLRRAIALAGGAYPDAEVGLSLMLAGQGNWPAAKIVFASVDQQVCRSDLLLTFARVALKADQQPEALSALQAVRNRGTPDSVQAIELLIANFGDWGQKDELISAAHELTRLEPHDARHWKLLIELLKSEVRREPECLAAIRQAMEYDFPAADLRELQHLLVSQLIVCGDAAAARRELEELAKTDDDSFRLRTYEIDVLRLEGRLHEALDAMNNLFLQVRDRSQASLNRGVIYLDLGRYHEAARDLEQAVAARPYDASAQFKLSEAYRGLGREELATEHRRLSAAIGAQRGRIEMLLKQVGREPENPNLCEQLAELYRELHDDESAQKWDRRSQQLRRRSDRSRKPADIP